MRRSIATLLCVASLSCAEQKSAPTSSEPSPENSPKQIQRRGLANAEAMMKSAKRCEPAWSAENTAACEAACLLNHSNSCANWGSLLLESSPDQALELFLQSCRGGSGIGCEAQARVLESKGELPAANVKQLFRLARDYHRVHCVQKYARSCAQLASLYEEGRGGRTDRDIAAEFRSRACALGFTASC